MVKRKMPAHIVLPNGMWRFIKGKAKTAVGKPKRSKRTKRKSYSGGIKMAKRRGVKRSRTAGGMLSKGILPVGGIIGAALLGAGAASLQEKVLPQYHSLQGVAIGFAVGGVGGAAGAYARNMLNGNSSTSKSSVTGY